MSLRTFASALIFAAALPALGACAQMDQEPAPADIPPGNVTGEAVSCIDLSRIRSTQVHGDETIDFDVGGGKVYRNILPNRCYSLGFEERFAYETSTGQLCSTDTITVLHSDGARGTTCGLGQFLPIELTDQQATGQ